jgi:isoleucyl-tRNA synthetase
MGTRDAEPYRAVLTHGFVVDGDGRKMSKSLGNTVAPDDVIRKYGAEVLRLWAASEDYTEDIRLSDEILKHLAEAYRRIRNTCRFLLGNLADFDPAAHVVADGELRELDRWAMLRLHRTIQRVRKSYAAYEFHLAFQTLHNFCAVDLSALYLDVLKDRLYTSAPNDPGRRAAQTVCYRILDALVRLMAPILSFTADEVWEHVQAPDKAPSVHLTDFPEEVSGFDERLEKDWDQLLRLRGEVARALEQARASKLIGASLDAALRFYADLGVEPDPARLLRQCGEAALKELFIVSKLEIVDEALPPGFVTGPDGVVLRETGVPGLAVLVSRARGRKCARCWVWSEAVGQGVDHPDLCERCLPIVRRMGAGSA